MRGQRANEVYRVSTLRPLSVLQTGMVVWWFLLGNAACMLPFIAKTASLGLVQGGRCWDPGRVVPCLALEASHCPSVRTPLPMCFLKKAPHPFGYYWVVLGAKRNRSLFHKYPWRHGRKRELPLVLGLTHLPLPGISATHGGTGGCLSNARLVVGGFRSSSDCRPSVDMRPLDSLLGFGSTLMPGSDLHGYLFFCLFLLLVFSSTSTKNDRGLVVWRFEPLLGEDK